MTNLAPVQLATTAPLQPRARGCPVPLTGSQRRLSSYALANGHRTVGTVAAGMRVLGPLDAELLQQSIAAVVERHESLRTRIVQTDGKLSQAIEPMHRFELQRFDLEQLAPASALAEARRIAEEYAEQSPDPARGPLFRAALLRLGRADHVLVTAADHIISDAASSKIVSNEIWAAYRNRGTISQFAPLVVQFADYAVWQAQTYDSWVAEHADYWRARLGGAPAARLPLDAPLNTSVRRTAASLTVPFGKNLTLMLGTLGRQHDVRLPLAVLALHACAMSRWCGQRDLCVSFASHGRHGHAELNDMVGLLASFPHLRIEIDAQDDFIDLLARVRREVDLAFAHFDFDRALELNPECGDSDVGFNWTTPEALRKPTQSRHHTCSELRFQPFPLRLSWLGKLFVFYSDSPAGVIASVTFRPDLFAAASVERFGRDLRAIAGTLAGNPRTPVVAALDQAGRQ